MNPDKIRNVLNILFMILVNKCLNNQELEI